MEPLRASIYAAQRFRESIENTKEDSNLEFFIGYA